MNSSITHHVLGDIVNILMGQAPSGSDCNFEGVGIPFVKVGEFRTLRPIIREWTTNPLKIAKRSDVLLCVVGATCGKINLGEECAIGRSVAAIRPIQEKIDQLFLYYFMLTNSEKLRKGSQGAAQTVISKEMINMLPISLPHLPEQQRIVAILDEAFGGIATAKANAEKNLKNAREIFDSYLQSVFDTKNQKCELVRLADLATDITDGDHLPPPKAVSGIPFITISNINKNTCKIDFTDTFKVPKEYYQKIKSHRRPQNGDVLYTVTGSYGIPVIIDFDLEFCFQRHIGLIRPKSEVDSKWLYYLLLSPSFMSQANEQATGTAQKTVSLQSLRKFTVPKIPLQVQRAIVARLDALSAETQRLESIYQRKIAALDELKQSLLQRAFAGEL